jgi:hypothetical protein
MRLPLGRERKTELLEAERLPPASAASAMTHYGVVICAKNCWDTTLGLIKNRFPLLKKG